MIIEYLLLVKYKKENFLKIFNRKFKCIYIFKFLSIVYLKIVDLIFFYIFIIFSINYVGIYKKKYRYYIIVE